jgi:LPS sulfotransferase NodH
MTVARSGSWHLVELMNSHPSVVCNGEPLSTEDMTWPPEMDTHELLGHGFTAGLRREPISEHPLASGFKVLRENLWFERFSGLLPTILGWPGLRVVILRRDNMLETLRSRTQAEASGLWQTITGSEDAQPAVTLSPGLCRMYFRRTEVFFDQVRRLARGVPTVETSYEQIVADRAAALAPIWALLDVDELPLSSSPLRRLEARGLDQTLTNYEELRAAFVGTPYSRFFQPAPSQ